MSSYFDPKNLKKMKLSELLFNDWNPKENEKDYEKVKKSVVVNGLITPIFVRKTDEGYEVVDGNQRARACKELGYTEIYVYDLGEISEAEAKQLVLYLQIQVPFVTDMLAPIAVELESLGMELPYNEKEMQKFRDLEAFDMDTAYNDEDPVPEPDKPEDELKEKLKTYKIKLAPEDFDFVRNAIDKVIMAEDVNEGRALQLLLENQQDGEEHES